VAGPLHAGESGFPQAPVPFWIGGALAALAGGVTEWSARLPSVLACLGTAVLLVLWFDREVGPALLAGFAFVTTGAALVWARRAEVDMQLCFWTTAAMIAYWFALREPVRRRQVLLATAMWLSLAAGVLTKGPLPFAFLGLAVVATLAFDPAGRRRLRGLLPLAGPLLLVAALMPWVLAVLIRHPGAISIWYEQSLGRYAGELGHDKPWTFYAARAPILWLPWIVPLGLGIYLAVRRRVLARPAWAFLLFWGVGGLVFLSLGTGKRLHYALPAVPPMMVFAGIGLQALARPPQPLTRRWRWGAWLHGPLVPLALAAGVVAGMWLPEYRSALLVLGALAAGGLGLALLLYLRGRPTTGLAALAAALVVVPAVGYPTVAGPLLTRSNTEAAIGRCIAARGRSEGAAAAYRHRADPRIVFYAARPIPVLEDLAGVAAWRTRIPNGYLVLSHGPGREGLERVGPWRKVFPRRSRTPLASREVVLLQAVAPPQCHVVYRGPETAPKSEKEVSDE